MTKTKIRLLILLSVFPFLVFMTKVKAYDFNGISKISRVDMGLYYDSTQLYQVSCTSSNDGYCGLEDSDLPNASNTYNNLRFVLRGNLNKTFTVGTQYKISWYFYQYTAGYFIRGADITQVTGNTYRDFTNWTSDSVTILTYNLSLIETESNKGLYRMDITFIPSTTNVAGFNFRLYSDYETISNDNNSYLEGTRYLQIVQLSADSPDYTQDLNNINQNISNMGDDIVNNQNQNTQDIIDNQNQNAQDIQDTINDNFQSCRDSYNLMPVKDISLHRTNSRSINIDLDKTYSAGTYTFSYDYFSENNPLVGVQVVLTGTGQQGSTTLSNSGKSTIIARNSFNRLYFYITTESSADSSVTLSNIMLVAGSTPKDYEPYGQQVCVNKLDEQNNAINGINDSLTDTTPPDTSGLSNAAGWLPAGPVDSILNLPLTLLQSLNNAFSTDSCQPLVIHFPHISSSVPIPCMSTIWQNFGLLPLFTWIGRVIGGILLYKYLINLYKWVDDTLTMRENNNFDDGSLG